MQSEVIDSTVLIVNDKIGGEAHTRVVSPQKGGLISSNQNGSSMTYNAEKVIGNGSFGIVYQACVVETGEKVAIKKVYQDRRYKNRELGIMKEIDHPNIISLKHAFYTSGEKNDDLYLNVVMEFFPDTLYRVIKSYSKSKSYLPLLTAKLYAYQMIRSLSHIHTMGICHRDIKPQNLLVNQRTHVVKLCDFGSAKRLVSDEPNVAYICSRYYRAPELIFGATNYSTSIDIWSLGCVISELIIGTPLFPGESGVDQLVEIIKVLGTPSKVELNAMNPHYTEFKFPQIKPHPWSKVFRSKGSSDFTELISGMLRYSPSSRMSPLPTCLLHPVFNDIRSKSTEQLGISSQMYEELFQFTPEEEKNCTAEELSILERK